MRQAVFAALGGLAVAWMAAPVSAADLSMGSTEKVVQPPAYVAEAFNWTGFYFGGNVGYGWGSTSWSDIVVPSDSGQALSGTFSSSRPSGVVGGIQAGYNFQYSPMLVFGFEGSVSGAGLNGGDTCFGSYGDGSANCHTKVDWMADLSVRLGVTPINRLLIYGKVGAAYAHAEFQPQNLSNPFYPGTGGYGSTSDDRFGYLIGVGGEYAFNSHWSFGLEYDYRDFGTKRVSFAAAAPLTNANPPFSANTSLSDSTLVAKLNYRF